MKLAAQEFIFMVVLLHNKEMKCCISARLWKMSEIWNICFLDFGCGQWNITSHACIWGVLKNQSYLLKWMLKASCLRLQDPHPFTSVGVCVRDEGILLAPASPSWHSARTMLTEPGKGHTVPQTLARSSVRLPDPLAGELGLGLSSGILVGLFYLLKLVASGVGGQQ